MKAEKESGEGEVGDKIESDERAMGDKIESDERAVGEKVDSDERAMGDKEAQVELNPTVELFQTTSPVSLPILHVRERN